MNHSTSRQNLIIWENVLKFQGVQLQISPYHDTTPFSLTRQKYWWEWRKWSSAIKRTFILKLKWTIFMWWSSGPVHTYLDILVLVHTSMRSQSFQKSQRVDGKLKRRENIRFNQKISGYVHLWTGDHGFLSYCKLTYAYSIFPFLCLIYCSWRRRWLPHQNSNKRNINRPISLY